MIGEIKTINIEGTDYDIQKKGVTETLEIQSIFLELVSKSRVSLDDDESALDMGLMIAMRGEVLKDIKGIIIKCVAGPKLDSESYEKLPPMAIPKMFLQIYHFHCGEAEKKSETSPES